MDIVKPSSSRCIKPPRDRSPSQRFDFAESLELLVSSNDGVVDIRAMQPPPRERRLSGCFDFVENLDRPASNVIDFKMRTSTLPSLGRSTTELYDFSEPPVRSENNKESTIQVHPHLKPPIGRAITQQYDWAGEDVGANSEDETMSSCRSFSWISATLP